MISTARAVLAGAFTLAAALAFGSPAAARTVDHGETRIFTSVYVAPDDVVDGNVNVLFGDAHVAGIVHRDVNVLFGSCDIVDGGRVDGAMHCAPGATARAFLPWAVGENPFAEQDRHLIVSLAANAVVVLAFLLFPVRMRLALDRVERHPGLAALAGAIAMMALVPIALVLLITIIGIPLIVLEVAALFAGLWIGTGALALLVGRRLCELVMPSSTPSPLVALVLGLVVVSAAQIVPVVGWVVTALVWLVGLGATMLSFFRSNHLDGIGARTPIGGPPMAGSR